MTFLAQTNVERNTNNIAHTYQSNKNGLDAKTIVFSINFLVNIQITIDPVMH
jgi:hypothetical protein